MKRVYFEIFNKKIQVDIDDKAKSLYTRDQIEYYIRGKLKINKIEELPDDLPEDFLGIFNRFTNKSKNL